MTEALLPCPNPWCSSHGSPDGRPEREYDIWEYEHWYRVQCPSCPIKAPHAETEDAAVANWNARTAGQAELVEALERIVEQADGYEAVASDEWEAGYLAGLDDGARIAKAALAPLSQSKGEG